MLNLGSGSELETAVKQRLAFTLYIEKLKAADNFPLVIITGDDECRGIDMRFPQSGAVLIIDKVFTNKRIFEQALGRVGRDGDWAQRVIVGGNNPWNVMQDKEETSRLERYAYEVLPTINEKRLGINPGARAHDKAGVTQATIANYAKAHAPKEQKP